MSRNLFTPTKADVPFDPEIVADIIQYLPLDKNRLVSSGAVVQSNFFTDVAGKNTGKITLPAFSYGEFEDGEDWTGEQDGNISKLPNTSQTSVIVRKYKAWGWNYLANYIANGMTPEQAVANYISIHKNTSFQKTILSMLKGVFTASDIAGKMIFDNGANPITSGDFEKAKQQFWGDTMNEQPVAIICHSVVATALRLQIDDKNKVNFLAGTEIIVDDNITKESSGVYETYIFRRGAISISPELAGSGGFSQRDEIKNQGEGVLGYRTGYVVSPAGVDFKGSLAKAVGASKTELETGTNWQFLQNIQEPQKRMGIGMIKSTEDLSPAVLRASASQKQTAKTE